MFKPPLRVKFVDDHHGFAIFAGDPPSVTDIGRELSLVARTGDVLAIDSPVVCTQSLFASEEAGIVCCPHCLTFLVSPEAEVRRWLGHLQSERRRRRLPELAEADVCCVANSVASAFSSMSREVRTGLGDISGECQTVCCGGNEPVASYCSAACHDARCLGKCHGPAGSQKEMALSEEEIQCGSLSARVDQFSFSECRAVFSALASRYNERLKTIAALIFLLCQKAISRARVSARDAAASDVALLVDEFLDQYAEGALRRLNAKQRAVLRCAHKLLVRLTSELLPSPIAGAGPCCGIALPCCSLQQLFRLHGVLDANMNTCIIVSPLWAWLQRLEDSGDAPRGAVDWRNATALLREAVETVPPLLLHNSGVALYPHCSKFNHSCAPNGKFMPTTAPCRGVVTALKNVFQGDEVRVSYIDISEFGESGEDVESNDPQPNATTLHRVKLKQCYGFVCDCPLCGNLTALSPVLSTS